jgi:hypothetical protein
MRNLYFLKHRGTRGHRKRREKRVTVGLSLTLGPSLEGRGKPNTLALREGGATRRVRELGLVYAFGRAIASVFLGVLGVLCALCVGCRL